MSNSANPVSQTRSFSTIFLIELWERFGYYGMAAILVLFMVEKIGFGDTQANLVWGAFTALVYAAPAIGGWVGDNILGTRRTMPIGAAILAIGYLMLSIPSDSLYLLYASMGVIVVGNGLFKANAANMVRRIYEGDDAKIDSAFTMYYMAVNVGSTVSMLLTPWIKDNWGWHAAFAVCCGGLIRHRLAARRKAGAVEQAGDGARRRLRAAVRGRVRDPAPGNRGHLRLHRRPRDACHLRLHDFDRREERARRIDRCAT